MTDDAGSPRNGTLRPDPSTLTTQLVDRAISSFREVMETRLDGMDTATRLVAERVAQLPSATSDAHDHLRSDFDRDLASIRELIRSHREQLGERIGGMDRATELLAENVRQVPTDIDKAARALREILLGEIRGVQDVAIEKFLAIDGTFASNALALTAALAAQKEAAAEAKKSSDLAIDRANSTTKETIAANATQTAGSLASQAATIADLKDRVVRIESGGQATAVAHTERRLDTGQLIAYAVLVVAVISLVLAYVTKK